MQNAEIIQKLRHANLPVAIIAKTTLPESKLDVLRAIIVAKSYRHDEGLRSYVLVAQDKLHSTLSRVALASALMGKELAISGVQVRYTSLAGLIRDTQPERLYEDANYLAPVAGEGYIIVPDFDDEDSVASPVHLRNTLDFLGQHVSRGGGLILGKGLVDIDFPGSYFDTLYRSFETIPIIASR